MAPELLAEQPNSAESDVYAMVRAWGAQHKDQAIRANSRMRCGFLAKQGMVLFEMFTRQDLYVGQTPGSVLGKVIRKILIYYSCS